MFASLLCKVIITSALVLQRNHIDGKITPEIVLDDEADPVKGKHSYKIYKKITKNSSRKSQH